MFTVTKNKYVLGALYSGIKLPVREADHSPPSIAEVKNSWSYTSSPHCVFMVGCLIKQRIRLYDVALVKHRDNFTFTVTKVQSI